MKKLNPFKYFANSIDHELEFVGKEKKKGVKIVGIYCEYTPQGDNSRRRRSSCLPLRNFE